jgi:hypothetical protein
MLPVTLISPTWRDVRRAIEIAQQDELRVVGQATINGTQVFAVPSRSHPGTVHLPYVDAASQRVICDCEGYHYRGVCAHAMVATRAIIAEAQAVVDAMRDQGLPALAPAEPRREAV